MAENRHKPKSLEEQVAKSPTFIRNTIADLTDRAARGDKGAAETLAKWLDAHPQMKAEVRQFDDLAARTEDAWVKQVGGGDLAAEAAAREEADRMKVELLAPFGPNPPLVLRLLASAVVIAHLGHQRAATIAAIDCPMPAVTAMRDRRAESALRRWERTVKMWFLVQGKAAKGLVPPPIRLFDPESQTA